MEAKSVDKETWFGPVISKYTAEDAVRDGVFVGVGKCGDLPIYFTSNLYFDGYEGNSGKVEALVRRGLDLLGKRDPEDSDYMKLRVIEKGRIWVVENGEGFTFTKPEDY